MAVKPPVFIVGAPRSGTTFLRNLLSRHPTLAICGETRFFSEIYQHRRAFGDLQDQENRRRLTDKCLAMARIRRLGLDLAGLREDLLQHATNYREFFTCIMRYNAESKGKQRYGEKTPHHSFFTETLAEWYPTAAILHLVRDPRDVVASLRARPWAPKSIVNNALMCSLFNRAASRSSHRPGYLLIHYERLVTHPEQEVARICAHLDAPCDPAQLLSAEQIAGPYTWPRHAGGPLTTERLGKWRELLTAEEISQVEWIAAKDMQIYGYERSTASTSLTAKARGLTLAAVDSVREQLARVPYRWHRWKQPTELATQEYWRYRRVWEDVFPGLPPGNKTPDLGSPRLRKTS